MVQTSTATTTTSIAKSAPSSSSSSSTSSIPDPRNVLLPTPPAIFLAVGDVPRPILMLQLSLTVVPSAPPVVAAARATGEGVVESASRPDPNVELVFTSDSQMERLDLPTERDILANMDIAASLRSTHRPQANLVPDQQDTVVAVGALMPADTDSGPVRKVDGGKSGIRKIDMRPFLMSPVADTVLGPASHSGNDLPLLDPVSGGPGAIDDVFRRWESDTNSVAWWDRALAVALGLALTAAPERSGSPRARASAAAGEQRSSAG
jgi:hypothetical protein